MKPRQDNVVDTLRERLSVGYYGRRAFPSERALAKEFSVSYMTARTAVLRLLEEGLLVREGRSTIPNPDRQHSARREFLFVVPNWNNPAYWLWYPAIEKAAARVGGTSRFIVYDNWTDPVIYNIFQEPADGIFIYLYPDVPEAILRLMEKRRGQTVIIGEDHTDRGIAMLDLTPTNGVDLLVQHLEELGHTQIDCFNSEPHSNGELLRVQYWQEALASHGLTGNLIDNPATPGVDALVVAYDAAMQRIRNGQGFSSAVFCTSTRVAMGLSRACYDLNQGVGSRISICTMGTYDNCRYLTPSLTCLVTPNLEIFADRAVKYIMEPAPFAGSSIRFQPQNADVYFGESTGPFVRRAEPRAARKPSRK